MTDQSDTTTNNFIETSYDDWSAQNPYDDQVESFGRYVKHLRQEYLDAGKYDERIERQLSYNLNEALSLNELVTTENVEEVNAKLNSINKRDLRTSVKDLLGDDEFNMEFLSAEDRGALVAYDSGLGDPSQEIGIAEIVRKTNEKKFKELIKRGEINAAVYEDEDGNEIFLGGRIPNGMSEGDLLNSAAKYGVRPEHLFNLRHKREKLAEANGLMRYEVEERFLAKQEIRDLIFSQDERLITRDVDKGFGKITDAKVRLLGLAKEYADRKTWDFGDRLNHGLSDGFNKLFKGGLATFANITGDNEKEAEYLRELTRNRLRETYADAPERTKAGLIQELSRLTDYSGEVLDDVINDLTIELAFEGDAKQQISQFTKFTDNEGELGQNVHKTRFSGVLVASDLLLDPVNFNKALDQAGVEGVARETANKQRELALVQDFDRIVALLRSDEDFADDINAALIEGRQQGLSNSTILENFKTEHDISRIGHRIGGVMSSVWGGLTGIVYGVGAAMDTDWGREGLLDIAKENAHRREVARVFGMEMGSGQDILEAVAPMMADALLTAGLVAVGNVAGGAASATYIAAKSSATVTARAAIKSIGKNTLRQVGKETADQAADRIIKAAGIEGLSKGATVKAVNAFNSRLAKRLNITASTFIPAASRSGGGTYSAVYQTLEDKLTNEHFVDGNWDDGWSQQRVKEEAHAAAFDSALVAGTITGVITAGFSALGRGGLEETFLRGMSGKQIKQITSNILGRNVGTKEFVAVMKESLKKVTRKHMIESPKGLIRSAWDEGREEALDEFFNTLVTDAFTEEDTSFFDRMGQVWHGFIVGAALGGGGNLVSKAAKNIAPSKFLDTAAAARVEREAFKQFEQDVKDKGLTEKLREVGAPTTAKEAERLVRQYKRSERPALEATVDDVLDDEEDTIPPELEGADQATIDELKFLLKNEMTPEAVRKELAKEDAKNLQRQGSTEGVGGGAEADVVAEVSGDSVEGLAETTSQHAAKNTQLTPEEEHKEMIGDIIYRRGLHKDLSRRIQEAENAGRTEAAARMRAALDKAVAEKRMLDENDAKQLRKLADDTLAQTKKDQAASDKEGASENDIAELQQLVDNGYAHTLTIEQLHRLGVSIENIDKARLRTLTKELKRRIEAKYPVSKPEQTPVDGAALPQIYGPAGKVYLDADGNGVFDNDPVAMVTLLESGIAIPVSETLIREGKVNPSFRLIKRGKQFFVSDIMVQESGGMVSARTAFHKVGALEEDYSRISELANRLNELKESGVEIDEETKVRNPFNTKSRIKLSTLLKRARDGSQITKVLENDPRYLKLQEQFKESAVIAASLEMQVAIYEHARKVAAEESTSSTPFVVAQVVQTESKYFFNQQVQRSKRAARGLVSVMEAGNPILNDPETAPTPNDRAVGAKANPLPPLPERGTRDYITALLNLGAESLDNNTTLKSAVASLLDAEYHSETGRAYSMTPDQLFDELVHFLSKGNKESNSAARAFQLALQQDSFGDQGQSVRKILRILNLSNSTVETDISEDADFRAQVRVDLQQIAGEDYNVTDDQAVTFHIDIGKHIEGSLQRAVINGRSMEANAAVNQAVLDTLGIEGNDPESVIAALERIVSRNTNDTHVAIAKVLLTDKEFIRSIKFSFETTSADYAGNFYVDGNGDPNVVINIARGSDRGVTDVLLHEIVHAFANRVLGKSADARTPAENTAINRIESVLKILRRKAAEQNAPDTVMYGLSNVEEFISVFLTSSEFQGFIKSIPKATGQRTFAQRVTDLISQLFARSDEKFKKALETQLDLTTKGAVPEPETGAGFAGQVAGKVVTRQKSRSRLASSIGMAEEVQANEALDNAAEEFFLFAQNYVPPEIAIVMDNTIDVIAEFDPETETIVFNGRRAAAKVAQMVAAADGKPIRRQHIIAAILNEEIAHTASFARLSQAEIEVLMDSISDLDAQSIIEQYYPEAERADALERFRSSDPEVSRTERFILAEEQLRIHVQKVMRGSETNQQVDFLLRNPSTLETVKFYFKGLLSKLTYARTLKDVSPEMRNAVNNVVREVRAMEARYRLTPNGMRFDLADPEATMRQLLKNLEINRSTNPDSGEDEDAEASPRLQSRIGSDALWDYPKNQEFTAADTSINQTKPPATFGSLADRKVVEFVEGGINADIGGGKFDNGSELLAEKFNVTNYVYDPFNRNPDHNALAVDAIRDGKADTATVNNVLNVVQEPSARDQVIKQAANAIGPDGTAYFLIFEGDKTGVGKETGGNKYQNNQKAEFYKPELEAVFDKVERKATNLLIASQPKLQSRIGADVFTVKVNKAQDAVDKAMFEGAVEVASGILGSKPHELAKMMQLQNDKKDNIIWDKNWKGSAKNWKSKKTEEAYYNDISKLGSRLHGVLERALYEYPEFVSWYEERVQMAVDIFEELDADIKNPEDNFVFKAMLAITSNGNKVKDQTADSWKVYQKWKETGKFYNADVKPSGSRTKTIQNHFKLLDKWIDQYGWEYVEEFLSTTGTVAELRGRLVRDFGYTAKKASDLTTGELIDEKVPFSLVFGAKLGSFHNNLNGNFDTVTMDRWFMRTLGRTAGAQVRRDTPQKLKEKKERVVKALLAYAKQDPKGELFKEAGLGRKRKMSTEVVLKLAKFWVKADNRQMFWDNAQGSWVTFKGKMEKAEPITDELRKSVNALYKVIDSGYELVEAPQSGGHRRFIRLAMLDAIDKLEQQTGVRMVPAEAQAILWYYEKAVHAEFGSKADEGEAPDYASAANEVFRNERGNNAVSFVESTANQRRGRLSGDTSADSGRGVRLQSRWGAGSLIPKELDGDSVDFSNWIEMLDLPLMEVGTYQSPSSMFGRVTRGYADRDIIRFNEEREAFVRETKKLVEDFKENHDEIISRLASEGIDIPPELISRASGSNMGSQLTDAQVDQIEAQFNKDRGKANLAKSTKQRDVLLDLAEQKKVATANKLRKQNHNELLADRNQALKDLMALSPDAHKLILDMRKLTDELSAKGNELFSDFVSGENLFEATFDGNRGIYITRRYRMFEDNDFLQTIRESTDPEYVKIRQDAINFFADRYMEFHIKEQMRQGLSKADATTNVELDLQSKGSTANTKGKEMMIEFINSYEKKGVTAEIDIFQQADGGRSIMLNQKKFTGGPLRSLVEELNSKKNVPSELRKLLGEYGDEGGITNLAYTLSHVAGVMANQAFFNRILEHGTMGDNPWLISPEQIAKDLELPPEQQKYSNYVKFKTDEGKTDWNPVKGHYVHPDVAKDFKEMLAKDRAEIATKETSSAMTYMASKALQYGHRATGLSLAAKTLGSVGFYVRNMLGNAMFFGPMQGYYGGMGKAFGEVGGVAKGMIGLDNNSMIVRAAMGSRAEMDAELTVLASFNVWGDEMEANALRDLLTSKVSIPDVENSLANLAKKAESLTGKSKAAYDKAVRTATRLASAMDAYYKIGLYEFELNNLKEAAMAEADKTSKLYNLVERNSRGEVILDDNKEPKITVDLKRAAAKKVKLVSQSYSQAPPAIKWLSRSPTGLLFAPYVRFAAEIPRVMGNTFVLLAEEKELGRKNPVMRKRYLRRLSGMMTTMGFTFALPALLRIVFAKIGEDEDEALRKGMPHYLRDHTFYFFPPSVSKFFGMVPKDAAKGEDLISLDLTYMNPFSVITDAVSRSFETLFDFREGVNLMDRVSPFKATGELLTGLLRPYYNEQILAGTIQDVFNNENQYGQRIIDSKEDWAGNMKNILVHVWEKSYEPRSFNKLRRTWKALEGDRPDTSILSSPLGMILSEFAPVKPHKVDLANGLRSYLRDHTEEYREINSRMNRYLTNDSMTNSEIYNLYDRIYDRRLEYNNEFRRIMRGYNRLGVSWNELFAQAKTKGVSKERLNMNYHGYMNRPVISKFIANKLMETEVGRSRLNKVDSYSNKYERYVPLND